MKLSIATILVGSAAAFAPNQAFIARAGTHLNNMNGMDMSGNNWKPDSEKMGSTDVGDYFPEDYNADDQPGFTDGMYGSQASMGGQRDGPELPGMENLGADAVMMGGIEVSSEIPAGMEFVAASVPDGEFEFSVPASSKGGETVLEIKPFCMGFEDYFAAFAPGSHPTLSVSPATGRMDRRGGEITFLTVACQPGGKAGLFEGDLVVNLPEDNSKLSYKIKCNSY